VPSLGVGTGICDPVWLLMMGISDRLGFLWGGLLYLFLVEELEELAWALESWLSELT